VSRVWRLLLLSQLREQPGRLLVTLAAIALGVALASSVYLVNAAALAEFSQATKRLVGESDIVVRGPRDGFADALFVRFARDPAVSIASPVLEVQAALPGRREPLKIVGLDPLRAGALQPALIGDLAGNTLAFLAGDGLFLSSAAAEQLHLGVGATLQVAVGDTAKSLKVLGILSPDTYNQPLGLIDIAAAQWIF
jgi:putative ABC transport system permease protein